MQDTVNGQMGDAQIDKINFFYASQRYALPLSIRRTGIRMIDRQMSHLEQEGLVISTFLRSEPGVRVLLGRKFCGDFPHGRSHILKRSLHVECGIGKFCVEPVP